MKRISVFKNRFRRITWYCVWLSGLMVIHFLIEEMSGHQEML